MSLAEQDYLAHDGVGPPALVASGAVTPLEVLEAAIARAEACADLSAIVRLYDDPARSDARAPSPHLRRCFMTMYAVSLARSLESWAAYLGKAPNAEELEGLTWNTYRIGKATRATDHLRALWTLGQTAEGVPIGVTFGARLGDDGLLLSLAHAIEQAQPFGAVAKRRPPDQPSQAIDGGPA